MLTGSELARSFNPARVGLGTGAAAAAGERTTTSMNEMTAFIVFLAIPAGLAVAWLLAQGIADLRGTRPGGGYPTALKCKCPKGMRYHANNCPTHPGEVMDLGDRR